MPYQASKIYYDGSHYIAVPKETFPSCKGRKTARKSNLQTDSVKAKFETAYAESQALPKRERRKYVTEKLQGDFPDDKRAEEYVKRQTERKRNNAYKRYTRLWHKVYLQGNWNFFVTCTYSDEKPKQHRMQTTYQNTHFLRYFGRNDFKAIDKNDVVQSVRYLLKYIEKSGERLVYGGDLPTYFKSDVMDEDIACHTGIDDRKALLFDDFNCWDEGCLIGKVSPETISQLPKCN